MLAPKQAAFGRGPPMRSDVTFLRHRRPQRVEFSSLIWPAPASLMRITTFADQSSFRGAKATG